LVDRRTIAALRLRLFLVSSHTITTLERLSGRLLCLVATAGIASGSR
jgi:hypothetical protein